MVFKYLSEKSAIRITYMWVNFSERPLYIMQCIIILQLYVYDVLFCFVCFSFNYESVSQFNWINND